MNQVSETITILFATALVTAMSFEINRRRKRLREIYDVLDDTEHHVVIELEKMVAQGILVPYSQDILV